MTTPHYVWSGRFQPFHNGHLHALLKLAHLPERRPITLGVLVFKEIHGEPSGPGDVREGGENNPYSGFDRRAMIEWLLASLALPEPVSVTCLPRTDIYWPIARDMLPPRRTICLIRRDRYDAFEDAKAKRYRSLGEDVLVLDVQDGPSVSGTAVRARLSNGGDISSLVPAPVMAYLQGNDLLAADGSLKQRSAE